jgi:hypothetical protein
MKTFFSPYISAILIAIVFQLQFFTAKGKAPVLTGEELTTPPPRIIRTCCSFGADVRVAVIPFVKYTDITSLGEIGPHQYLGGKNEGNGNIYTRRGGFIDMGHLRDCADWTAYLYNLISASRENTALRTTYLGVEGGSKTLVLEIPENTDSTDIFQLAGKIAYDLSLWHEIATWYGASYVPMLPERYSSFSPEDLYSNLLGVNLGIRALQSDLEYDEAMTRLIAETLDSLKVVETREKTFEAMQKVEEIWWTDEKRLPSKKVLLKRYLDAEISLTPWLIPGEKHSPSPLVKPGEWLNDFYQLEIRLNFRFPVKSIFGKENNRTITQNNFGPLLRHIQKEVNQLDNKITSHLNKKEERKDRKTNSSV